MESPEMYTDVEISKSPEEWKYVERLLPSKIIPKPQPKVEYPSGWKPPTGMHFLNLIINKNYTLYFICIA